MKSSRRSLAFSGMFGLFFVALTLIPQKLSAAPIELSPIIKEGSPGEALADDPVVPVLSRTTSPEQTTGSLEHALSAREPFPVVDTGRPGALAQFRGLGRSAEDIDVQTLGIPLNYPQGGGFDFSVFPQFIWSGYRFQQGPSLGAFDPRGVAGSLTLVPWTAEALARAQATGAPHGRVTMLGASTLRSEPPTRYSTTTSLGQVSIAGANADAAAVVGYSGGDTRGPSGAVSARFGEGRARGKLHLLASRLDAKIPGAMAFPSPGARQLTARIIPVGQLDIDAPGGALVKASAFFDGTYLRFDNPDDPTSNSRDQIRQLGTELAVLAGPWKLGTSYRHVTYEGLSFTPPGESIGSAQASRALEWGDTLLEPTVRLTGVSRQGILPEGSVGARRVQGPGAFFARATFSRRFPSLFQRYYVSISAFGVYRGNPELAAEKDWTGTFGYELVPAGRRLRAYLQSFSQLRQDTQVSAKRADGADTLVNRGDAQVNAIESGVSGEPIAGVELSEALTLTHSRLSTTNTEIPYLPVAIWVAGAKYHINIMELGIAYRLASSSLPSVSTTTRVGGYGALDMDATVQAHRALRVTARVDNLFDRRYESVQGYPHPGRVYSLLATAVF